MYPTGTSAHGEKRPLVTYTLIALNVIIFLWDRQWNLLGPQGLVFGDLAMKPNQVTACLVQGGDRFPLVTLFTSMFLHGNLAHIVANMLYLLTFGDAIEDALGSWRFMLYYLFWGVVAAAAHVFVHPGSSVPMLGASGAIGGALGCYFLLFPSSKIEIWAIFLEFEVRAFILLGLWFLFQILVPQEGVANWAHAGGFLAGMITVMVMGGRKAVLKGREEEYDV